MGVNKLKTTNSPIMFEITKYLTLIYRWNNAIQEELEDTKGVIRICKSKKDRQHNGQKIPKG
jgi:hypothetical protein